MKLEAHSSTCCGWVVHRNGKFHKTNCKNCDRKHSADYKAKNLDKVREVNREYGRKNKNKRKEYQKRILPE